MTSDCRSIARTRCPSSTSLRCSASAKTARTADVASTAVQADTAPKPVGAYPHARRVGDLLFLSGIGPRDPASDAIPGNVYFADGRVRSYDIAAQARAVFANVRAVLEASGARWEDLVDVTVYLTDMARDFKAYNAVWAEHFPDPATAPCRTTLGITALPTPIAIELKCVAALPAARA
ncbi:RidA family protein [Luteimonas sp. MC1750]|nr:RidA family protein [Luteimonas sp. MC1750]QQO04801.1 RidA family protein [Luteimonas sp. MC1750]